MILCIQGGANSLKYLVAYETVGSIVERVKEVNRRNKGVWIVLASSIPRPCEEERHEREI